VSIAKILSTKKLTHSQKELLLNANISFVEANFIKPKSIDFECESNIENGIITSKNAVKSILKKQIKISNCFCVGDKTEEILIKNGFSVVEKGYQANALAEKIIKKHSHKNFTFFCGDKRREELPVLLKKHNIILNEIEVYKTKLTTKQIDGSFDGILFFSPSAIQSYVLRNEFEDATVFCIGRTTEAEAKKHTNNIITANKATIENVIVQVVKHFK
jgi:uroporphyrinogen-III synthase